MTHGAGASTADPAPGFNAITPGASAPTVFHFNSLPITVILKDGDPWFIASEVLAALELHRTAIRRLEEDEKGVHKTHTLGGEQEITIISDPLSLIAVMEPPMNGVMEPV